MILGIYLTGIVIVMFICFIDVIMKDAEDEIFVIIPLIIGLSLLWPIIVIAYLFRLIK